MHSSVTHYHLGITSLAPSLLPALPITDVPIDNLIRLALLPQLPRRLDQRLCPVLLEIVIRHDLPADELVLKVRASAGRNESALIES